MESQETPQAVTETPKAGRKSVKVGVVTSNKMTKTIVVSVERRVPHPLYRRIMTKTSKFLAHDEKNACSIGDTVSIAKSSVQQGRVLINIGRAGILPDGFLSW